jgi:hypothetical protein
MLTAAGWRCSRGFLTNGSLSSCRQTCAASPPRLSPTRKQWLPRLGHIRRSQLAIEIEERDLGICSIATAVTGPTGALQALVMMLPAARFKVKMGLVIEGLRQLRHGQRLHDQEFPSDRVSESFTVATASRTAS